MCPAFVRLFSETLFQISAMWIVSRPSADRSIDPRQLPLTDVMDISSSVERVGRFRRALGTGVKASSVSAWSPQRSGQICCSTGFPGRSAKRGKRSATGQSHGICSYRVAVMRISSVHFLRGPNTCIRMKFEACAKRR